MVNVRRLRVRYESLMPFWDRVTARRNVNWMKLRFELAGQEYEFDSRAGRSIAIALDFDGPQPSHFGAAPAKREPLRAGDFVGRTQLGGSCNVDCVQLIPHCNGTHTETVGHIVNEAVPVGERVQGALLPARLVTVAPVAWRDASETYVPQPDPDELVVSAASLREQWPAQDAFAAEAIIIRTLPNDDSKRFRQYAEQPAPFFTIEAIELLNEMGIRHLIVDLPSLDRIHDEGRLTCHHRFWHVPDGGHEMTAETERDKTVTEMVFVPNSLADGVCLVDLQVAPFLADAAPSRPIVYPLESVSTLRS